MSILVTMVSIVLVIAVLDIWSHWHPQSFKKVAYKLFGGKCK